MGKTRGLVDMHERAERRGVSSTRVGAAALMRNDEAAQVSPEDLVAEMHLMLSELRVLKCELQTLATRMRETVALQSEPSPAEANHTSESSIVIARPPVPTLEIEASSHQTWLLRWGSVSLTLKDCLGIRYIASLVSRPNQPQHVLDLVRRSRCEVAPHDRGDAGPMLDREARVAYKLRLEALALLIEQALGEGDGERVLTLCEEREQLERELSRAQGLGGRQRRAGSSTQLARSAVQRRIRYVIEQLASMHEDLAQHLGHALRTGTYCVYRQPASCGRRR
jgi:hypothetical protein